MNWYVKNPDGKVFGPADDAKLLTWVRDGRVEPFAGISNDLKSWRLASCEPALEMEWIVESDPGRFYGPTHRAVIDDLFRTGAISESCRIYRDYRGGELDRQAAEAKAEAERAMAELKSEAEKAMAELKNEAEKTMAAKDSEISALLERVKTAEALAAELERELTKINTARQRVWESEVLEPEVVSSEPPPTVRDAFRQPAGRTHSLADLERQAQAELARMGAAGAKKFFGFKH